ncbi:MAG TPA: amino-acid N-acetyltransferase, partial [Treponemataceae bacterium]|nr:amino-acid N-acetyltransferase [Treponemataceae bacterium]
INDELIDSPYFLSIIKDLCYIHEAGIKLVIIPGAKHRIDKILTDSHKKWSIINGLRVTTTDAMPLIKMAAFDNSNRIMTALAGEGKDALIGNWVQARATGIIHGVDYGTSGEIEKIKTASVQKVLDNGFILIFPCIGWNTTGTPYNISSISLSAELAIRLKSEKLFFVTANAVISPNTYKTQKDFLCTELIDIMGEAPISAMNLDELEEFLKINPATKKNKDHITLLKTAQKACSEGVPRIHILNGSLDGALPCELFSGLGSGTMIYLSNYSGIRSMSRNDIPGVLNLMRPFIEKNILIPRTAPELLEQCDDFIVYEMDGGIKACAALHLYEDNQAEIAAIAVDQENSHLGTGPKLVTFLLKKANQHNCSSVFALTTQTADWFIKLGFSESTVESLPKTRRDQWSAERGSKVFRFSL